MTVRAIRRSLTCSARRLGRISRTGDTGAGESWVAIVLGLRHATIPTPRHRHDPDRHGPRTAAPPLSGSARWTAWAQATRRSFSFRLLAGRSSSSIVPPDPVASRCETVSGDIARLALCCSFRCAAASSTFIMNPTVPPTPWRARLVRTRSPRPAGRRSESALVHGMGAAQAWEKSLLPRFDSRPRGVARIGARLFPSAPPLIDGGALDG